MPALFKQPSKGTLKEAIKFKCQECTGGCKEDISKCTAPHCPLFDFRPYQNEEAKQ